MVVAGPTDTTILVLPQKQHLALVPLVTLLSFPNYLVELRPSIFDRRLSHRDQQITLCCCRFWDKELFVLYVAMLSGSTNIFTSTQLSVV